MDRRSFLRRLPAAPVAVVAMVSQVPLVLSTLGQRSLQTVSSIGPSAEISMETKIGWFNEGLTWIENHGFIPTLSRLEPGASISTIEDVQSVMQWQKFSELITVEIVNAGISESTALQIIAERFGISL